MAKAPSLTLKQIVQAYLDDLQVRGYKPKTIRDYQKTLHTLVNWAHDNAAVTLAQFDAELVKDYGRYLQQKTKWSERSYAKPDWSSLSASTIRNYVRELKTFAGWLAEQHYTPENVLSSVKRPKADEVPIQPFTDE